MIANDDLQQRWWNLEAKLVERFGKKPDVETILFLIGMQEFGDIKEKFTKEQKQDLMHVAICSLLSPSGFYELESIDDDGWPHFKQLKAMPDMDAIEQENYLKDHILLYFAEKKKKKNLIHEKSFAFIISPLYCSNLFCPKEGFNRYQKRPAKRCVDADDYGRHDYSLIRFNTIAPR